MTDWRSQLLLHEIEIDQALILEILRQARTMPGQRGHNVGGWRSNDEMAFCPEAQLTLRRVCAAISSSLSCLQAWAIVHERGSFHDWHAHTGIAWRYSGVLYLTTGGGATIFRGDGVNARIDPRAGMMLTFPPTIEHATEPHNEPNPRITLAFNALD